MTLIYILMLALISLWIAFIQEGQLFDRSFYLSSDFQAFFAGSFISWLGFVLLLYKYGESKKYLKLEQKWNGALLGLVPCFAVAVLANLLFAGIEIAGYKVLTSLIASFIYGVTYLQLRELAAFEKGPDLGQNPFDVSFRFVQKSETDQSYAPYETGTQRPIFIECTARQRVNVALLIANERDRPYCSHPPFKVNSDSDVLYMGGEPFSFTPDQKLKLWLVASPSNEDLMEYISRNDLEWPSEQRPDFKSL
jgi:hypothetical protein